MEAVVILARCSANKLMFGMRTQKMSDGDWWRTWAFPLDEHRARKEGYDLTPIQGNLYFTESYPGCPYCGTKSLVHCNICHKLTCWNNESHLRCAWCGNNMRKISQMKEKLSLMGGDI